MLKSLQSALQVAQKIQNLLDSDEWDEIQDLIEVRDSYIHKAGVESVDMTSQEQLTTKQVLDDLLLLNQALMEAAQIHRDDLFQQIKVSNKSKQMNKAYKQI